MIRGQIHLGRVLIVVSLAAVAIVVFARSQRPPDLVRTAPISTLELREGLGPELAVNEQRVKSEENGWLTLISEAPKDVLEHTMIEFTDRRPGSGKRILEETQSVAIQVDRALAQPKWSRLVDQGESQMRSARARAKSYGRVLQMRLDASLETGSGPEIMAEARRVADFSDRVLGTSRTITEWMDGVLIARQMAASLGEAAESPRLETETVRQLIPLLETRLTVRESLAQSMKRELDDRFVSRGLSQGFPAAKAINAAFDNEGDSTAMHPEEEFWRPLLSGHPEPLNVPETLAMAKKTYGLLIQAVTQNHEATQEAMVEIGKIIGPYPQSVFTINGATTEEQKEKIRKQMLTVENPYGKYLILSFLPSYGRVSDPGFRAEATMAGAKTVLAMRVFGDEKGTLPRSLDELVAAGLLAKAPINPYDGKAMVYDPALREISISHPTESRVLRWKTTLR